jgi:hypothetical protein
MVNAYVFFNNNTAIRLPLYCLFQPVLAVGKKLGIKSVSLISSCSHSIKKFRQTAMEMGILVGRILKITEHSKVIGDFVKKFFEESVCIYSSFSLFQETINPDQATNIACLI